jgi:hypothetical protein
MPHPGLQFSLKVAPGAARVGSQRRGKHRMASSLTRRALGTNVSTAGGLLGSTAQAAPVTSEALPHAPSFDYQAPKVGMLRVLALGGAGESATSAVGVSPMPIAAALPASGR